MAEIRDSSFSANILGFKVEYENIYNVLYQYIIFIITFIISASSIKKFHKIQTSNLIHVQLAILFAFIMILIKLSKYGFLLFSGDYYSRFNVDTNLLVNLLPTVFVIIAIDFLHRNNNRKTRLYNKYLNTIIGISILSILAGSRSTAFYALIATLAYYFIPFKSKRSVSTHNPYISTKNIVICLFLIYIFGQLTNVLRWFSTDATLQDSIIAILGDSFPEYRSHSQVEARISGSKMQSYSFVLWIQNLSAYIFPGFVFEAFDTNRAQIFNQIWTDFFQPIIWGNKEALYGIRTGLIGEIGLALGNLYIVIFAFFFAYILQKSKSKVSTVTCLVGTIPYGATAIFILFYCILFQFSIKIISSMIQTKQQ